MSNHRREGSSPFSRTKKAVRERVPPFLPPSWRLLEKAGFRREAHFRENVFFFRDAEGNPVWKDTFVYALLNDRQI